MKKISLKTLAQPGIPGLHPIRGSDLAHAAIICLEDQQHKSGVLLKIDGAIQETCLIYWEDTSGEEKEQIQRTWNDKVKATEDGACAIAILIILKFTQYTIDKQSRRGTGFDYHLSLKEDPSPAPLFQQKARLEVSGILHDSSGSEVIQRIRQKEKQIQPSNNTGLPAYIVIVEFSSPLSMVVERKGGQNEQRDDSENRTTS